MYTSWKMLSSVSLVHGSAALSMSILLKRHWGWYLEPPPYKSMNKSSAPRVGISKTGSQLISVSSSFLWRETARVKQFRQVHGATSFHVSTAYSRPTIKSEYPYCRLGIEVYNSKATCGSLPRFCRAPWSIGWRMPVVLGRRNSSLTDYRLDMRLCTAQLSTKSKTIRKGDAGSISFRGCFVENQWLVRLSSEMDSVHGGEQVVCTISPFHFPPAVSSRLKEL